MDSSLYRRERVRAIPSISDFASRFGCSYDGGVLELEVYAVGARDRNKILKT